MIKPSVERACSYDLPILNQISVSSKMHWDYPIEWLQHWVDALRVDREYIEQNHVYKLVTDRVIGFCAVVPEPKHFEITHLWILPGFMGKGYGKMLLMETLKAVVKQKSEIIVEADPNAEEFYEKMGFTTYSKKESYPAGRYLPLMKRMYP